MQFLPSGSVLPSGLLTTDQDHAIRAFNFTYGNYGIKAGVVVRAIEIDDPDSITKASPEYDVAVLEQAQDGAQNTIMYKNCPAFGLFGGIADFFEYRVRAQKKVLQKDGSRIPNQQDGAIVTILCMNGNNDKGLIIGGAPHPLRPTTLTSDAGHSLAGAFNGIGFTIDENGALVISFTGATNNDGSPVDTTVGGTYVRIEKDGSIQASDGKGETLRIDKTKQTATLTTTSDTSVTAGGKYSTSSTDATSMTMKDWMVAASGSATLGMKGLTLTASDAVKMSGASWDVQSNGPYKVTAPQITLDGLVNLGGAGGSPALVLSTMFLGTGNLGLPVLSTAIGPFSSKVFVSS